MAYANLSAATKLSRTNTIIAAIGNDGFMQLWTGNPPASPDLDPTGQLLVELPLSPIAGVASLALKAGFITSSGTRDLNGRGIGIDGTYALVTNGNAVGSFTVSGGLLTHIDISDVGSGYVTAPILSGFEFGGRAPGATAIAIMTSILVFNPILPENSPDIGNSGNATWARIMTSGRIPVLDLDVGTTNSYSVVMDNTFIQNGDKVTCSAEVLIEAG